MSAKQTIKTTVFGEEEDSSIQTKNPFAADVNTAKKQAQARKMTEDQQRLMFTASPVMEMSPEINQAISERVLSSENENDEVLSEVPREVDSQKS